MTVDLSKAKAGDTVKFRCGGEAVIESIQQNFDYDPLVVYSVTFVDADYVDYGLIGNNLFSCNHFDITEVIPAPEVFDWGTVKAGDGFLYNNEKDEIFIYVGIHPISKYRLFTDEWSSHAFVLDTDTLTRSPEHDIKERV